MGTMPLEIIAPTSRIKLKVMSRQQIAATFNSLRRSRDLAIALHISLSA